MDKVFGLIEWRDETPDLVVADDEDGVRRKAVEILRRHAEAAGSVVDREWDAANPLPGVGASDQEISEYLEDVHELVTSPWISILGASNVHFA